MKKIGENVENVGIRFLIKIMLRNNRPSARELLRDPFVMTIQQIISGQKPTQCHSIALQTCLHFQNKQKAQSSLINLLRAHD